MKSGLRYFTIVSGLLAFVVLAFSQSPTPALLSVTRVQIRNDKVAEFLEISRQVAEAVKKEAPAGFFTVTYRTVLGNANEFWRITPMNKFADRDGQPPLYKMTTPEQRATLVARMSQYVERSLNTIERPIPDLTVRANGANTPPAFMRVYRTRVKSGMEDQFINILKTDVVPAIRKMDGNMRIRQTELGGNTNDFTGFIGFDKWAELDDETTFQKAMGGEQAVRKWAEKMSQVEVGTEQYVLRYEPELSYFPASAPKPSR